MVIKHEWEWEGKTTQNAVTVVRSATGFPVDDFPSEQVIGACKIAILSEITNAFQTEMTALGFTTTVTKIEPSVWIETTQTSRQYRDYTETHFYHYLHMKAIVSFDSDKALFESPLSTVIIAALVKVVVPIVKAIIVGLVLYYAWIYFVDSFLVETTIVRKYDENGNLIDETITKKPSMTGQIGVVVIAVVLGIVVILAVVGTGKLRGKS